jgi:hypothetical protein
MDKMQDSGSCDLGSIPGGITCFKKESLEVLRLQGFLAFKITSIQTGKEP